MIKRTFEVLFSLILLQLSVSAQNSLDSLLAALDKYNKEYPQEKVYLHFDKPYYYANEDIWFQAYLVAGPLHEPSPFSTNLYVELISQFGDLIDRKNILIQEGAGKGDFLIPKELPTGTYTVRAYTNWMRNFDQEYFFSKQISIIKPTDGNPELSQDQGLIMVDFYPEGGNLVEGVESKVAIRVSTEHTLFEKKSVRIYRDDQTEIANLVTNADGISTFSLTPEPERTYYAQMASNDRRFNLPRVLKTGYVMGVDNASDSDEVIVTLSHNTGQGLVNLIAQTRGVITFASQLELKRNQISFRINKEELLSGVTHLTLFDKNWIPQAERLFFHISKGQMTPDISTDRDTYYTRDSVVLKLKVIDQDATPIQGVFSMSVLDSSQINASLSAESIVSNLLLTSDLSGYVNNPKRFFSDRSNSVMREELDKLMLVNGWRRFTWQMLAENDFPEVFFGVEQGITLQGRLLNKKDGNPVEGGKISHIGSFGNMPSFASTQSLSDGFFVLGNLQFYEGEENFLKGEYKEGKRKGFVEVDTLAKTFPDMQIETLPSIGLDTMVIAEHIEKSIEREYIKSLYEFDDDVIDLGEVVVEGVAAADRAKKKGEYYAMDMDALAKTVASAPTIFQVLRQRLPSTFITGFGPNTEVELSYGHQKDFDPIMLVDGNKMTAQQIAALPPNSIKKVEIHKGMNEIIAWSETPEDLKNRIDGGGGIIEFTTRSEEEMLTFFQIVGDERVKTLPGGYYSAREFSAPRYFPEKPEHSIPDNRVLIHWEPMIKTNEDGEAEITFYNADLPTTVSIFLEGLTLQGIPVTSSHSYLVLKKESN